MTERADNKHSTQTRLSLGPCQTRNVYLVKIYILTTSKLHILRSCQTKKVILFRLKSIFQNGQPPRIWKICFGFAKKYILSYQKVYFASFDMALRVRVRFRCVFETNHTAVGAVQGTLLGFMKSHAWHFLLPVTPGRIGCTSTLNREA